MYKEIEYRQMEFVWLIQGLMGMYHPAIYLECGIRHGHTFRQVAHLADKAIGLDIADCSAICSPHEFYHGTTSEFMDSWKGKSIDMIFHDASHDSQTIQQDVKKMRKVVTPYTGLILIHDTYPMNEKLTGDGWCGSAWSAAKMIHDDPAFSDFEIATLPGPWAGISILRYVPEKHLHWKDGTVILRKKPRRKNGKPKQHIQRKLLRKKV